MVRDADTKAFHILVVETFQILAEFLDEEAFTIVIIGLALLVGRRKLLLDSLIDSLANKSSKVLLGLSDSRSCYQAFRWNQTSSRSTC